MSRLSWVWVIAALLATCTALILTWAPWRDEPSRIKAMVTWPSDCASVTIERYQENTAFPRATSGAVIQCQHLGPLVIYAAFPTVSDLRQQLRERPPDRDYCISGDGVLLDGLDDGFAEVCEKFGGHVRCGRKSARVFCFGQARREPGRPRRGHRRGG